MGWNTQDSGSSSYSLLIWSNANDACGQGRSSQEWGRSDVVSQDTLLPSQENLEGCILELYKGHIGQRRRGNLRMQTIGSFVDSTLRCRCKKDVALILKRFMMISTKTFDRLQSLLCDRSKQGTSRWGLLASIHLCIPTTLAHQFDESLPSEMGGKHYAYWQSNEPVLYTAVSLLNPSEHMPSSIELRHTKKDATFWLNNDRIRRYKALYVV